MASTTIFLKLDTAVTVVVVFSLLLPLPTLAAAPATNSDESRWKKAVLGSRPPQCVGKCLNCRPCTAELVVPEHRERKGYEGDLDHREEDDSYYLLHWKCKCGNKLYHP